MWETTRDLNGPKVPGPARPDAHPRPGPARPASPICRPGPARPGPARFFSYVGPARPGPLKFSKARKSPKFHRSPCIEIPLPNSLSFIFYHKSCFMFYHKSMFYSLCILSRNIKKTTINLTLLTLINGINALELEVYVQGALMTTPITYVCMYRVFSLCGRIV